MAVITRADFEEQEGVVYSLADLKANNFPSTLDAAHKEVHHHCYVMNVGARLTSLSGCSLHSDAPSRSFRPVVHPPTCKVQGAT